MQELHGSKQQVHGQQRDLTKGHGNCHCGSCFRQNQHQTGHGNNLSISGGENWVGLGSLQFPSVSICLFHCLDVPQCNNFCSSRQKLHIFELMFFSEFPLLIAKPHLRARLKICFSVVFFSGSLISVPPQLCPLFLSLCLFLPTFETPTPPTFFPYT